MTGISIPYIHISMEFSYLLNKMTCASVNNIFIINILNICVRHCGPIPLRSCLFQVFPSNKPHILVFFSKTFLFKMASMAKTIADFHDTNIWLQLSIFIFVSFFLLFKFWSPIGVSVAIIAVINLKQANITGNIESQCFCIILTPFLRKSE